MQSINLWGIIFINIFKWLIYINIIYIKYIFIIYIKWYITLDNLQGVFIGAFTHILVLLLGIFV